MEESRVRKPVTMRITNHAMAHRMSHSKQNTHTNLHHKNRDVLHVVVWNLSWFGVQEATRC